MPKYKAQHTVPKTYLSAWCDPAAPADFTPYVWVFPRTGGQGKKKAPINVFVETDFYTIPTADGGRDLRLEHGLNQLETRFGALRRRKIQRRERLSSEETFSLAAFVAAMHTRTVKFRDHHKREWQHVVDMGDQMAASMAKKAPSERLRLVRKQLPPSGPTLDHDEARAIAALPTQKLMEASIRAEMRILPFLQFEMLIAPGGHCFITSDNPVSWHDPDMMQKPLVFRHPTLLDERIEILMPIGPDVCLMAVHGAIPGPTIKETVYKTVTAEAVALVNERTSLHSDKDLAANTDAARVEWFT